MKRFWLSFADGNKPAGFQFLGAAIVLASRLDEAIRVAHILGCNPGGEVQSVEIPVELKIPSKWIELLLTRSEIEELDAELAGEKEGVAARLGG